MLLQVVIVDDSDHIDEVLAEEWVNFLGQVG